MASSSVLPIPERRAGSAVDRQPRFPRTPLIEPAPPDKRDGEQAAAAAEADKALYRAKRLGRDRVEQDDTYKDPEPAPKETERKQRGES